MIIGQNTITVSPPRRGCHLITREVERGLRDTPNIRVGLVHLFLQHTSASLTLNENASPEVPVDLERLASRLIPDGAPYYDHTIEGPDDMSAHGKSSVVGTSLTLPVTGGRLNLGTWQGIYLWEHRERPHRRRIVITVMGE